MRSVESRGPIGLVEIEAGPFQVTAAITRDAIELGLEPGVEATAMVEAASVMVIRGGAERVRGPGAAPVRRRGARSVGGRLRRR